MSDKPSSYNRPERPIFENKSTDAIAMALMTLTKELWVVKDRFQILEAVLDDKGINVTQLIDEYQPDPELQERLNREGRALVENIISVLERR